MTLQNRVEFLNVFANSAYMISKLNLNWESHGGKQMERKTKQKHKDRGGEGELEKESREIKGALSGGREAAEYISAVQVKEINRSRPYPSSLPHLTSLLLTRGEKSLANCNSDCVCVSACAHV